MTSPVLKRAFLGLAMALALLVLPGCETTNGSSRNAEARAAMLAAIAQEQPGDYFIGRRFYKKDYKVWGYVRRPGQPWATAKLVMMNEQQKLAPDREKGTLGSDNNFEYTLRGSFSGETIYEPASNGFYPEFVLRGYEIRSETPAPIFKLATATDPERRVLPTPY